MTLYLWDIDGTLLRSDGAGREALEGAFEALHGIPRAFQGISFAGATDRGITRRALEAAGLEVTDQAMQVLWDAYVPRLRERLAARAPVLMPGVLAALDAVEGQGSNALPTGNQRAGARAKLEAVALHGRFGVGAYGCDEEDRNLLVPVAEARARRAGLRFERTVVIGDTPADVACAHAAGARCVAVCTGWVDRAGLEAAGADVVVEDLAQGLEALLGA